MLYFIGIGILVFSVSGCQRVKEPHNFTPSAINPRIASNSWDHKFNGVGKLFGDVVLLSSMEQEQAVTPEMHAIYKALWKATLTVLYDFSLERLSLSDGIIETQWFKDPKKPKERFKIACTITATPHWVKSITVLVDHEIYLSQQWQSQPPRKELAFYIKDAILTTARKQYIDSTDLLPKDSVKNTLFRP